MGCSGASSLRELMTPDLRCSDLASRGSERGRGALVRACFKCRPDVTELHVL